MSTTYEWIDGKIDHPRYGQVIVAYWIKTGTYWAGRYLGAQQTFDLWYPLPEPAA